MAKRFLVSTTTRRLSDGMQIDAWDGEYTVASDAHTAETENAEWISNLMILEGTNAEVDGNTIYYTSDDGEELYITVTAEEA